MNAPLTLRSPSTASDLNKKIYGTIEVWRRNRPIEGDHPYAYLDGKVLKRSWVGSAFIRLAMIRVSCS
jgi:hypothetical protein